MEDKPLSSAALLITLVFMLFVGAASFFDRHLMPRPAAAAQSAGLLGEAPAKPKLCDLTG
jgi:hypothetical protein